MRVIKVKKEKRVGIGLRHCWEKKRRYIYVVYVSSLVHPPYILLKKTPDGRGRTAEMENEDKPDPSGLFSNMRERLEYFRMHKSVADLVPPPALTKEVRIYFY